MSTFPQKLVNAIRERNRGEHLVLHLTYLTYFDKIRFGGQKSSSPILTTYHKLSRNKNKTIFTIHTTYHVVKERVRATFPTQKICQSMDQYWTDIISVFGAGKRRNALRSACAVEEPFVTGVVSKSR